MSETFALSSLGRKSPVQEAQVERDGIASFRTPHKALDEDSLATIESAVRRPALFTPPVLMPPSQTTYTDMGFIAIMESFHITGDRIMHSLSSAMASTSDKLKQLAQENLQKLKEAAEKTQESDFWSLLKKIGQCVIAAISMVFGVTLVASGVGTIVGSVMIASGVLQIANFAMTETGSWDWVSRQLSSDEEKRKQIAYWLPVAAGLIAASISAGGSAAALIWSGLNMSQQAFAIAQAALGLYEGATTVGKGVSDAKLLWTQAELIDVGRKTALQQYKLSAFSQSAIAFMRFVEEGKKQAEETISLITQINQKAVYQG